VIGVFVLVVVVVLALLGGLVVAVRDAAAARRIQAAVRRVRAVLAISEELERRRAVAELAQEIGRAGAPEAGALVLACRRSRSAELVPVFAAALGHTAEGVAEDAARALADCGAAGLRAAWRAWTSSRQGAPRLRQFLLSHPDWLFERLLEDFVAAGAASVHRHADLWREPGTLARLRGLARTDAVGALRAREIARLLGVDDGAAGPRPQVS
jgi:hypothetical protein